MPLFLLSRTSPAGYETGHQGSPGIKRGHQPSPGIKTGHQRSPGIKRGHQILEHDGTGGSTASSGMGSDLRMSPSPPRYYL